jgi:hypothetical protein
MSANLQPITSDGGFSTIGNVTVGDVGARIVISPDAFEYQGASPAPNISGFNSALFPGDVTSNNISLVGGYIKGGIPTVVDDGINAIYTGSTTTMDVFGFPFTQITRGQLSISGDITPTEALGVWYYQSINTTTFEIFTDSTYSTPVDSTSWAAYSGGGNVTITKLSPPANIVIDSNGYLTVFDNTGNVTAPGNVKVNTRTGNLVLGRATATGSPGLSSTSSVTFAANRNGTTKEMVFDTTGGLSLPGDISANNIGNISGVDLDGSSSNVLYGNGVFAPASGGGIGNLSATGNVIYAPGSPPSGFVNFDNSSTAMVVGTNTTMPVQIVTDELANNNIWAFDVAGNLTIPAGGVIKYANGTQYGAGGSYGDSNVVTLLSSFGSNTITTTGNVTVGDVVFGANAGQVAFHTGAYISGNANSISRDGSIVLQPYTGAGSTFPGVVIGGAGRLIAPNGSVSQIFNTADVTFQVATKVTAGTASTTTTSGALIVTGGTGISGNLNVGGNISGNTSGFAIGYRDIPQVSASNTTLGLTDAGKHYYSTTAGNFTLTIPNNATTSFATGTAISIVVQAAGNILVNAASGVTLYLAGNSTAANRTVGAYGMATLMKVASDTWFINGTGVS